MTQRMNLNSIDETAAKNVRAWLEGDYDNESKQQIAKLLNESPSELEDAFYKHLDFGTGGLRGVMGVGTNRINGYTIRATTQALANYIKSQAAVGSYHSVIIGYDCRQNSRIFASEAAKVLAANGIEVYLFDDICPTPLLSFGCRHKKCSAGIMITASHNPPQYNGYKVYWNDGGQVLPPHDRGIISELEAITDLSMVKVADSSYHPLIQRLDREVHEAYYDTVSQLQTFPEANRKNGAKLKVVYSNLHGTGITLIPETLERWGFTNLTTIDEQNEPDGGFPTVASPNPEEPDALRLGIEKLKECEGDILIATDPDADRMGLALIDNGKAVLLSGNEIACLCLEHLCSSLKGQGKLPDEAAFIKTVVTSELFSAIAGAYGKHCFNVLTGFKYIAGLIAKWEVSKEKYSFIFGAEESYGYLLGTQSRDKDGVLASALICEVALHAKLLGKSLIDKLHDIYRTYGVYVDMLHALKFSESKSGHEQMARGLEKLELNPPTELAGVRVRFVEDYSLSIRKDLLAGSEEKITLPKTSMMAFWLVDGSKVIVRPSGTEPKVKIYCSVGKKDSETSISDMRHVCREHCKNLIDAMISILSQ